MIQLTLTSKNYSVKNSNANLTLEGNLNSLDKRIINFYAYLYKDGTSIGSANYSEMDNGVNNYNFNIKDEDKDGIITLFDNTIVDIKTELINGV